MKTTRTQLIEQAALDNADEGTEWRERVEAWMDAFSHNETWHEFNARVMAEIIASY